jgi:hypothetical protein
MRSLLWTGRAWTSLLSTLFALGCAPAIPDATYVCAGPSECPPGMSCSFGLCRRGTVDGGAPCVPSTCTTLRANCGMIDDGCGTAIPCGECVEPETCGGGGLPNVCDCTPRACTSAQCGLVDAGCGFSVDCGGCQAGFECVDGMCACEPAPCSVLCGSPPDGCGGTLSCGGCPPSGEGEFCGGGGSFLCGLEPCVPLTVCPPGSCGAISNGCDGLLTCPGCTAPETCGGGNPGVVNVCGCTPRACGDMPGACGMADDGCGGTLRCSCTPPRVCMAGRCEFR